MENGDVHARTKPLLDLEALGRLDVLKVDAAEGRLQGRDHINELLDIRLVHLDVEHVDVGKLLEQDALAFHHRLGGERTDRTETEDGRSVGDHGHEVPPHREFRRAGGIFRNREGRLGDPGGIGPGQVALVGQRLRCDDLDLARPAIPVIAQRRFANVFRHQPSPFRSTAARGHHPGPARPSSLDA